MRKIKRIFVHCTAGPQTQSVATIQNYWKKVKKWDNPGYHYIIKPDGEIVPLQPEDKPSNGVAGYNSTSINVCYIGGVNKQGKAIDNRTEAQKQSLITILTELKSRYPDAEIMGHRDIWGPDPSKWKKMCPCFNAKEEYKEIGVEKPEIKPEPPIEEPKEPEYTGPDISQGSPIQPEKPIEEHRVSLLNFILQLIIKLVKYVIRYRTSRT